MILPVSCLFLLKKIITFPSHIIVDFKDLSGDLNLAPDGYCGLTAYVYLRNSKKRLTETFAIKLGSDSDFVFDGMTTALFKNIPANEIDSGKIYLVTLITETVQLKLPGSRHGVSNLQSIRKGVCAGAVDISRIFSRREEHLNPEEPHEFSMKLYASFMSDETENTPFQLYPGINPLLAMSMTMANNGWGELIDRLISGSNKGIAINPRLDKFTVSIKELKNDSFVSDVQSDNVIDVVRTLFYDPAEPDYNRIYLKVVRATELVGVKNLTNRIGSSYRYQDFITIDVRSSSKDLMFVNGSNDLPQNNWRFVSTSPEEHINEVIQITGLPAIPSNENDFLFFDVYVNGIFYAEGKYPLRVFNQISDSDLNSKKPKKIDLFSQNATSAVGSIELSLEYVGKTYNVETYVEMVLNWRSLYEKNLMTNEKNLIVVLDKVRKTGVQTVVKFFPELISNLFDIYRLACDKHQLFTAYGTIEDEKFKPLAKTAFECIVHILDMVIARQASYKYMFDDLLRTPIPQIGNYLIADLDDYLGSFETTWNSTSRAICRVSVLVLSVAVCSVYDHNSFLESALQFSNTITTFLSSTEDKFVSDQLVLIDNLEVIVFSLRDICEDYQLVKFITSWCDAIGLKGMGSTDELSTNVLANKKKLKAHSLMIKKMMCLNRAVRSFLIESKSVAARELLISTALGCSFDVIFYPKIDLDVARLAFGVILACFETSFALLCQQHA
ncbi:unnamed protein product [Ambrosiozyma monospora]|uniref:Unnamed protein product n=1 Tax=Ambrosiozyma monospora TaxID=43982 RepID=A0A9W7DIU4_AMBMO|nr:unnamed protein product [Ambrosiozyma monospora]